MNKKHKDSIARTYFFSQLAPKKYLSITIEIKLNKLRILPFFSFFRLVFGWPWAKFFCLIETNKKKKDKNEQYTNTNNYKKERRGIGDYGDRDNRNLIYN